MVKELDVILTAPVSQGEGNSPSADEIKNKVDNSYGFIGVVCTAEYYAQNN